MERQLKNLFIVIAALLLFACATSNDTAPVIDPLTGKHPIGWAVAATGGSHPPAFLNDSGSCYECHGSDLKGGISKVSCSSTSRSGISCHPNGPAGGHPAGWSAAGSHGASVKAAPAASQGLAYCTQCHGINFAGAAGRSCMSCHATAPHPAAPWRGTTASAVSHTSVNEGNAPECSRCHANNARLTTPVAASAGATCFNNTLCHGSVTGHPSGWSSTGHQSAAKAAAGAASGFDYCRNCHGTDFKGGTAGVSCFSCHTFAPHAKPWQKFTGAAAYLHSTTEESNAPSCGRCHAAGAKLTVPASPPPNAGCFNSTLCHGMPASGHAFPNPGSLHKASTSGCSSCHALGSSASAYPTSSANLPPDCKSCHKLSAATNMTQMTGCSDCHGDASSGRPNGALFPNIKGRHSSPGEHAVACSSCHANGGTGTVNHGNSNNGVKVKADVILNGTASGMNIIRNSSTGRVTCTGTCHSESHNGASW